MRIKGATEFDKLCHKVYSGKSNGEDYLIRDSNISCGSCGSELGVYYCEERLYLVECRKCRKKALVEATSPASATFKTFAHALYPVDEMGEEEAVFFSQLPINDPPCYVGSVIDSVFPDDAVCGMYLPCTGTNGAEILKEKEAKEK